MKIQPRGKYVLIERDPAEGRESEHGIIIPGSVEQEEKAFGTVVSVGPDVKDLKKGDHVIYGAFSGEELEIDEKGQAKKFRLMEDEFVIAFIK